MCDPKSTKTDAAEKVWGKNIHERKSKEKQDTSHSWERDKVEKKTLN